MRWSRPAQYERRIACRARADFTLSAKVLSARYHRGVTTTLSPRERAAQDAAALVATLRSVDQTPVVAQLIELGEHLERAILAFHMEAIRFRAFTMSRLIKQHTGELPGDVPTRMDAILHDLEAAGFQTKSVSA